MVDAFLTACAAVSAAGAGTAALSGAGVAAAWGVGMALASACVGLSHSVQAQPSATAISSTTSAR